MDPASGYFNRFMDLSAHIRIKIWKEVTSFPRIIEMEDSLASPPQRPIALEWMDHSDHLQVSRWSRQPPQVLHVYTEARHEAMKVYRLIKLDIFSQRVEVGERPVYYNPNTDIIYFGPRCCPSSMLCLFRTTTRSSHLFPRIIAIEYRVCVRKQYCCFDIYSVGGPFIVFGGVEILKAIHGQPHPDDADSYIEFPGSPHLKEICLIEDTSYSSLRDSGVKEP